MKLFINEIIVDDRIRKNPTHIKELIDDIEENGQIQPITVRIDDNGSYRLVAGFRRLTAMKVLGEQKIEAYVISEADEEKLLKMEISENEVRESFTRTERMEYIKRLEEIEKKKAKERQEATRFGSKTVAQNSAEPGESRKKVAEQIGISHDTISKEKKIIEHKDQIDPGDFKDWDDGKLSTNKVYVELKEKLRRAEQALDGRERILQHSIETLKSDKERLKEERDKWEKLYKDSGRIEPALDEQAKKDMDYLTRGIQTFLSAYGGKAWAIDRRQSIEQYHTEELTTQARNLLGFATNLYEMVKGENK